MSDLLLVLAVAVTIGYLLLRINIFIEIDYRRHGKDDLAIVKVSALKNLLSYEMKLQVIELTRRQEWIWLESEIETPGGKIESKALREQRFLKKAVRILIENPRKIKRLLRLFRYYRRIYRYFMDRIIPALSCERLVWRTALGGDDAAVVGIATGAVWASKGIIVSALQRRVCFAVKPVIKVVPDFNSPNCETDFKCIFRISLGNVINTIVSTINLTRKGA